MTHSDRDRAHARGLAAAAVDVLHNGDAAALQRAEDLLTDALALVQQVRERTAARLIESARANVRGVA